jgi:hypothetical protein
MEDMGGMGFSWDDKKTPLNILTLKGVGLENRLF